MGERAEPGPEVTGVCSSRVCLRIDNGDSSVGQSGFGQTRHCCSQATINTDESH